jgi:signal transduction histidine kinase
VICLLLSAVAFLLPWRRLPRWLHVLVPLVYTVSVLTLILAAGSASGVGIVILVPLIWTALFQDWWDSSLVLLAIIAVEIAISLTPDAASAAVLARRVVLWAALGAVLAAAAHGLRDRLAHARNEAARLQAQLRDVALIEDRDRIAADFQQAVVQRLFAVGLDLQGAADLVPDGAARERVESAVSELDGVIRAVRDSIYKTQQRVQADLE